MDLSSMRFKEILQKYWGYPDFRGIQREIIESIGAGRDTLGLMPTGGGKSITFQVPALAMEGICIVVTPLISLMKDQVLHLRERGILAAAIYSGQTKGEMMRHLDNAVLGAYKFLYVSPERLATPLFIKKVQRMKVSILTIDEAHCISQWGYDFRPHYLRIAEIRPLLPGVPVLALTATATPKVVDDIQEKLGFQEKNVFQMSFERSNLHYIVRPTQTKLEEMIHILRNVAGSAIVYTRSRNGTKETADYIQTQGITATYYHAGLRQADKDTRQQLWQCGEFRVMVATNAFGMGIDKPDVRLVIHLDVPDTIEAYFQEAGRGGRDGQTSYAVQLYTPLDIRNLRARVPQTFPDRDYLKKVYADLAYFFQIAEGEAEGRTFDFDINRFCRVFKHHATTLVNALQLLERAGYIHFAMEDENDSRIMFLTQRDALYHINFLSPDEDKVMQELLRHYSGIFADFVRIDEKELSEDTGLDGEQVYRSLCTLSKTHIIQYIPHKNLPQITYTQRRIDAPYVQITPDIYELRKEQYVANIESIIRYVTDETTCRSRTLLRYFGEKAKSDCGYCDVCVAREKLYAVSNRAAQIDQTRARILSILDDGLPHPIDALTTDYLNRDILSAALTSLLDDELIVRDGLFLRKAEG